MIETESRCADGPISLHFMGICWGFEWCAVQGLNLRPLPCQAPDDLLMINYLRLFIIAG